MATTQHRKGWEKKKGAEIPKMNALAVAAFAVFHLNFQRQRFRPSNTLYSAGNLWAPHRPPPAPPTPTSTNPPLPASRLEYPTEPPEWSIKNTGATSIAFRQTFSLAGNGLGQRPYSCVCSGI
jgi:hypothetical protein